VLRRVIIEPIAMILTPNLRNITPLSNNLELKIYFTLYVPI